MSISEWEQWDAYGIRTHTHSLSRISQSAVFYVVAVSGVLMQYARHEACHWWELSISAKENGPMKWDDNANVIPIFI